MMDVRATIERELDKLIDDGLVSKISTDRPPPLMIHDPRMVEL